MDDATTPEDASRAARAERRSGVLDAVTSFAIGIISILVAFSAYQAAQYGELSSDLDEVANRMLVQSLADTQENYTQHLVDLTSWQRMQEELAGDADPIVVETYRSALSDEWLDAMARAEARLDEGEELVGVEVDSAYLETLTVGSDVALFEVQEASDGAREASQIMARQTGASVVYSAALLLLSIGGASRGVLRVRWTLLAAALVLTGIGFSLGVAEIIWPW